MADLEYLRARDQELARKRAELDADERTSAPDPLSALLLDTRPDGCLAPLDQQAKTNARRLAEFKERTWRAKVRDVANVRVASKVFGELKPTPALTAIRQWLESGCEHDFVLRGGLGTGKSTAACYAVRHWCEPDVYVSEVGEPFERSQSKLPVVSWLRPNALVSAIEHDYDAAAPRLHRFVVIEDLGRETRPEFVESFCELLDRDGHTLLITTNLTRKQMRERYEPRVIDRLNDRAEAFDVPGESMRRKDGSF